MTACCAQVMGYAAVAGSRCVIISQSDSPHSSFPATALQRAQCTASTAALESKSLPAFQGDPPLLPRSHCSEVFAALDPPSPCWLPVPQCCDVRRTCEHHPALPRNCRARLRCAHPPHRPTRMPCGVVFLLALSRLFDVPVWGSDCCVCVLPSQLRGQWENVKMVLRMEPNLAFSYLEEVRI